MVEKKDKDKDKKTLGSIYSARARARWIAIESGGMTLGQALRGLGMKKK